MDTDKERFHSIDDLLNINSVHDGEDNSISVDVWRRFENNTTDYTEVRCRPDNEVSDEENIKAFSNIQPESSSVSDIGIEIDQTDKNEKSKTKNETMSDETSNLVFNMKDLGNYKYKREIMDEFLTCGICMTYQTKVKKNMAFHTDHHPEGFVLKKDLINPLSEIRSKNYRLSSTSMKNQKKVIQELVYGINRNVPSLLCDLCGRFVPSSLLNAHMNFDKNQTYESILLPGGCYNKIEKMLDRLSQ